MRYVTTIGEREYLVEILDEGQVAVDGVVYNVDFESLSGQPIHTLLVDNYSYEGSVYLVDEGWQVLLRGTLYLAQVEDEREKRLRASLGSGPADYGEYHLRAPMPGLIVSMPVKEGQAVEKGDVLVILESMKMQNELKSPRAGKIGRLRVKVGDSVEQRTTLLSVE
jgi:acetyl/propionyl-CoA carboxylase alpha subunit